MSSTVETTTSTSETTTTTNTTPTNSISSTSWQQGVLNSLFKALACGIKQYTDENPLKDNESGLKVHHFLVDEVTTLWLFHEPQALFSNLHIHYEHKTLPEKPPGGQSIVFTLIVPPSLRDTPEQATVSVFGTVN